MTVDPMQLAAVGKRLAVRRPAILTAWRSRVRADPQLVSGRSLPAGTLNDHLGALLEDFERRLQTAVPTDRQATTDALEGDAAAHGLHRWQQGYDVVELTRELGRLNETVVAEINRCASGSAFQNHQLIACVHEIWSAAYGVALESSADQFSKLRQIEAASQVSELEAALSTLKEVEQQRAELWRQAAHDLRGNLTVVVLATAGLSRSKSSEEQQDRFLISLERNVRSLTALLHDVTSLARLQGGQETRLQAPFDADLMLRELIAATEQLAAERGIALIANGKSSLLVEGDKIKCRRVIQNLLMNALRYTTEGAVTVTWGEAGDDPGLRWFVQVEDTGPGLPGTNSVHRPASQVAGALMVASEQARLMSNAADEGTVAHAEASVDPEAPQQPSVHARQDGGEGIGLSIVKRLCALLDATIEVQSTADVGTTFRVLFPKSY